MSLFLILFSCSFLFFSASSVSFAQAPQNCAANERPTDFGCIPDDPVGFVQKFYGIGLGFLSMVVVIFFVIGGYYLMTSRGDSDQLQKGKSFIYYALAGLLLGIFGFVFFQVVAGDFLRLPGF